MSHEQAIEQVEAMLIHLKEGDSAKAEEIYKSINLAKKSTNADLFSEIGKLTRELHDALTNFKLDAKISDLAAHDVPDAKDQLEYVIKMTDDAANKTMDAVETSISLSADFKNSSEHLVDFWGRIQRKEIKPGEFKVFFDEVGDFLIKIGSDADSINHLMNEVLLAQGFQDLTGQVIKRVITLVKDVEESLVHTIKMFGQLDDYKQALVEEKKSTPSVHGPTIDAEFRADVASSQDDVDDILSSLGF